MWVVDKDLEESKALADRAAALIAKKQEDAQKAAREQEQREKEQREKEQREKDQREKEQREKAQREKEQRDREEREKREKDAAAAKAAEVNTLTQLYLIIFFYVFVCVRHRNLAQSNTSRKSASIVQWAPPNELKKNDL